MPFALSVPSAEDAPLVIHPRFCGPPNTGNGGVVAGALAARTSLLGPIEVTLRAPAPLGAPLSVRALGGTSTWALEDADGACVAEARACAAPLGEAPPALPSVEAVAALAPSAQGHPFPGCFVCGPARAPGDGLRILPREVPGAPLAAALWIPATEFAGPGGFVDPAFAWAALDCPGYFGTILDGPRVPLLLGRMTAAITGPVRAGARLRVLGWALARNGRRHTTATALVDEADRIVARSRQVWIAPRPAAAQSGP
jgi:hypothetical protein